MTEEPEITNTQIAEEYFEIVDENDNPRFQLCEKYNISIRQLNKIIKAYKPVEIIIEEPEEPKEPEEEPEITRTQANILKSMKYGHPYMAENMKGSKEEVLDLVKKRYLIIPDETKHLYFIKLLNERRENASMFWQRFVSTLNDHERHVVSYGIVEEPKNVDKQIESVLWCFSRRTYEEWKERNKDIAPDIYLNLDEMPSRTVM